MTFTPDDETLRLTRADLIRFLRRKTGDAALSEDLAQEALARIIRAAGTFRGEANPRSWTRQIAVNVWRDHLRSRGTEGGRFSVIDLLDSAPDAEPEDVMARAATHECLLDATRQLPLDRRRAILLHDFGEMPLEEVAAALHCSPGAAKVRLHRARRQLAALCRSQCACEHGAEGDLLCAPKPAAEPTKKSGRRQKSAARRD